MITCPDCQHRHVTNTIFCDECGKCLLDDEIRETDIDMTKFGGNFVVDPKPVTPLQPDAQPLAIRLRIGRQKREVEVPLDRVIHLGRISPASNTFPEIDLSEDVSSERTISRRHARILRRDNKVIVEDLNSVNGTFINDKKLDPYLPEPLNDGDMLRLGRLPIEIKILKVRAR